MHAIKLVSIQIGLPRQLGRPDATDLMDQPWTSGFFKSPVNGEVKVGPEGIEGDGVADHVNHGGPDKAVLAYAASNYPIWQSELARDDIGPGGFGENLTLDGLDERTVRVGDRYRIGDEVIFEVSQPRFPCWKLGRRWRIRELPEMVMTNGRSGWYLRVMQPGNIEANQVVERIARPFESLTIQSLNDMVYGRSPVIDEAVDCPALFAGWRRRLAAIRDRQSADEED